MSLGTTDCHRWVSLVTTDCHRWVSLGTTDCHRWGVPEHFRLSGGVSLGTTDCHKGVSLGTMTITGGVSLITTDSQVGCSRAPLTVTGGVSLVTTDCYKWGVLGHQRLSQTGSWGHWYSWGRGDAETVPSATPSFCLLTMFHQASVNVSAPSGQGVALGAGPQPLSEQRPHKQWVNRVNSRR